MSNEIKIKEKKVFLDGLPKHQKGNGKCGNIGSIDWESSVGARIEFIYDDILGEISIVDYNFYNKKLLIEFNSNTMWISSGNLKYCKIGKLVGMKTNEFKYNIGDIIKDEKRNITITNKEYRVRYKKRETKSNDKWYKYKCNKCGWTEGWIEEGNLKSGNGCSCCYGKTAVLGINTIWDTDRWMCDLGVSEEDAKKYTKCSQVKIYPLCPHCGCIKEKGIKILSIYSLKTIGCTCGDGFSYPEKFINSVLQQLNVKFITQYSPCYLNKKKSDFFLDDCDMVIEADGKIGHEGGIIHSKSDKTLEECIAIDKWKDGQHAFHGIKTIRIDCFESNMEYIKNSILNSELVNYFDINKIDWLKCEEFALSNRIKEVCDYWNNKEEWETTTDLAKKINMHRTTLGGKNGWLAKGSKLGWCSYDPKEEALNKYKKKAINLNIKGRQEEQ